MQNEKVVGIVSDRDLKVISGLKMLEKSLLTAEDIMSVDPITVDSSTLLDEVAFEMSERKIGSVIVTENDQFVGIFTVTDALNAFIEAARAEN
jgi:acetoin utilization protein AcuB